MFRFIFRTLAICLLIALLYLIARPNSASSILNSVLGTLVQKDLIVSRDAPAIDSKIVTSSSSGNLNALTIDNIIDATNKERIKANLPPFKVSTKLIESAKIKTNDMVKLQYFEHTSPSGVSVSDLGNKVDYDYIIMGENLALGDFSSSSDLLNAWMKSPGHRANILNSNYQEIGVYAMKASYKGKVEWLAVQHFGTSREVCPNINQNLKESIFVINTDLKKREVEISALRLQLESTDRPKGQAYMDMVNQFNTLVNEYNAILTQSQIQTGQYNMQVRSFNSCLGKYQGK